jgi:hypothetical protein
MLCQVKYCRFRSSHVTCGHKCGKCGKYGHGQIECSDNQKINLLYKYGGDIMSKNNRCTIVGCQRYWSHSNVAHHCSFCNGREHDRFKCPHIEMFWKINCPICRLDNKVSFKQKLIFGSLTNCCCCLSEKANVFFPECGHLCICKDCCKILDKSENKFIPFQLNIYKENDINSEIILKMKNIFKNKEGKLYTITEGGTGCSWYIRRSSKDTDFEGFFMHSENWGQYDTNCDDRPYLNLFIEDYQKITDCKTKNITI